ncbi:RUS1 family protein C16orf58 homolog [Polyodon spathula]|uniref:RUS1 family protein C16orf58 homolog n=1 Tax=Polyodon spathula TaxID=7913 RepID=UPI001B7F317D|nr:RUS1 family protein C16orf58 homolog [Polyodon spathula]
MMDREKEAVLATERYGSRERWRYRERGGEMEREREGGEGERAGSFVKVFTSVFLPQGYPESVSEDYLRYQMWDTLQAFSSSLTGTLSTQATLRGVGVGSTEASVAAATVTWILRDGTGMLGRILFAWVKGSKLDCDAKKWRLFADVLNDVAIFMEIVAPAFPACFTLIVCSAGVFKSLVGVAGGATRAALTVHQARRDNMADVSAKDGSQETLVNLAGLLVSLLLIPLVTDSTVLTFALYFLFTCLHLYANYQAVRSVVMETLNQARLSILTDQYLRDGRVLSLAAANHREPVLPDFRRRVQIRLGVRLGDIVSRWVPQKVEPLRTAPLSFNSHSFIYYTGLWFLPREVCVCLSTEATPQDEIQASFHSHLLSSLLLDTGSNGSNGPLTGEQRDQWRHTVRAAGQGEGLWALLSETHCFVDRTFPDFLTALQNAGWQTGRTLLDWDEWRVNWEPVPLKKIL